MPHDIDIYNGHGQTQHLKEILDTTEIKNALGISLTEKDDAGVDLGTPNLYGVCEESPYILIPNYLPQLLINIQEQVPVDQEFSTAEVDTGFYVYYAYAYPTFTPQSVLMAEKLAYIAVKLLEHRTGEEPYWISMTLPTIEVNNEVNQMYQEQQIPVKVGRVSFRLRHIGFYRQD